MGGPKKGIGLEQREEKNGFRFETMEVKVLFFGVLSEVTGYNVKPYNNVNSTGELRLRIEDDFPEIAHYNFRISVNQQIINGDSPLTDGDEVAYLPPFAGG
jgi:molybdopterin synthase sulfur carrier subunit